MFHTIEKFRGTAQVLLGLIAVSFVGFGVSSFQLSSNDNYIVKVGDEIITRQQLDEAIRNTQQAGGVANRQSVFQTLLDQAYLMEGARQLGVHVSDEQIKQNIVDNPMFHDANNKFDQTMFENYVARNFASEEQFMEQERRRLILVSLLDTLGVGAAADVQANLLIQAQLAPRQVRSVPIVPEAFATKVATDDATLQKYYDAHKADYVLPQAVKYEYVVLSPKLLAEKETVSEDEIKQLFETQKKSLSSKRRLAHILFSVLKDADATVRAKAKADAEKVAAELSQQPEKFAQLAKQYSQDVGTKDKGGDLGEFAKNGALGSQSLEDAAFALKEGEISGVVESDFGYHIIRATDVDSGDLESKRVQLTQQVKEKKGQAAYNKLREALSDAAFVDSGSLKSAADKLGLTVQVHDEWFSKPKADDKQATAVVAPAVVDALFSPEMLSKKHNSEGISVNGETWFVRVTDVRPETTQTFAEVKDKVRADLVAVESSRLAKESGEKILKELREGKVVELAWSPYQTANPQQLRIALPAKEFKQFMTTVPKEGKPAYVLLDTQPAPQLVEVKAIESLAGDTQLMQQARQITAQNSGNNLIEAFIDSLQGQIKTQQGSQTLEEQ